jgi:two-component system phosphate regulon sensor histidine kinase PhoR
VRIGLGGRFFLVPFVLIATILVAAGGTLEHTLRLRREGEIEAELVRLARMAEALVEIAPSVADPETDDALADRMGEATGARVTILAADGRVLGDSDVAADALAGVENHARRPEVVDARTRGIGMARRHSATVGSDMLYLAVPYRRADGDGVVRVALPLARVDAEIRRLRLLVIAVGLAAVLTAAVMSRAAARLLTRTLRGLIETTARVARGEAKAPPAMPHDEVTDSIRALADGLERSIAALAAERDRFEAVLHGMDDAVLALDADRRIVLVNRAARALFELAADPTGRTLPETVRVPALIDLVAGVGDGRGEPSEFEVGTAPRRRVTATATPLRAGGGMVVVAHDVTDLRRLETMRKDFVANVSHELRTPVAIIRANVETLLGGALEDRERARGFLDATLRHVERLAWLIADLLDVSTIEAGRYPLALREIEIGGTVRRVVAFLEREAAAKGLVVAVDVPEGLTATADAEATEHVLLNLLENAVKYTPAGGRITVAAAAAGDRTRIAVADDGPGIEPRHRERLFERFYRVDPGRSREMGGTGLGLAIAKHLTAAMGGRIGMDPATPRGSVFWILLPRGRTAA